MKLTLENIGMLEHAEITLHKLCVIAGENDQGKSTVGKIVFCIVKAINRYKEDLQESKEHSLFEKTEEMYYLLRSGLRASGPEVFEVLKTLRNSIRQRIGTAEQLNAIDAAIASAFDHNEFTSDSKLRAKINDLRDEIQAIQNTPENIKRSIENAFNKVFASEFDSSLLLRGALEGHIRLTENSIELIHLSVKANGVTLVGEVETIALKDATFVESPLILNNHDLLQRSQTLLDMDQRRENRLSVPYTTLHTKDLFDKLLTPAVLAPELFETEKGVLIKELHEIIGGEILYEKKERDFAFRKQDESFSIKNTASGIKVFGLLQILIATGFVGKNTILIFDEPENHLHPKWQLKLAEVLLKLVEKGVYVWISSHSPYLIEALQRGVDRRSLRDDARFCLAQKQHMADEDSLSDIFSVLAEPFETFREMDAEALRDE